MVKWKLGMPKTDGYYWVKEPDEDLTIFFVEHSGKDDFYFTVFDGEGHWREKDIPATTLWYGPIKKPPTINLDSL